MKKQKRYDRKNFKKRLSSIVMIYLEGLGPKRKEKMKKYLNEKLSVVVDYYVMLLKKKNLKMPYTIVSAEQIEKLCPEARQADQSENLINDNMINEVKEPANQQQ